ncbi:hypothetical protein [Paracoccus shanxieyensis]|uniref:Uncharacterized protein n=1 Tax=Paracoccus shanxieyensis TaxID=2675752 RepID=A0A6L6J1B0_9RHOB|nr:hypothetical protein [Paracoccus shanxieyensis]MTH65060.1 hypothetical protein [Paracoccus shanxieyensis]MTH88204.1 hypothetical protein [Paracoccus shanxieyensis]
MAPRPNTGPIDDAEAWIIATPEATYASTAEAFGLGPQSIRARILNRYGSLAAARLAHANGEAAVYQKRILGPVRRCIRCGKSSVIDQGRRMCDPCGADVARIHDGAV